MGGSFEATTQAGGSAVIHPLHTVTQARKEKSTVVIAPAAMGPLVVTADTGTELCPKMLARYQKIRTLQRRKRTAVFLVVDRTDGCPAVVKVLDRRRPVANPQSAVQVYTALGRQPHPNLLAAKAIESANGRLSIVLPYVEGGDLVTRVSEGGPVPAQVAQVVFRQLLQGLRHLHRLGFAHLDISPENILVDDLGHTCIIDYEYAIPLGACTSVTAGKPQYMAPEHLGNLIPGCFRNSTTVADFAKADVFALGCVLFIMLFGCPPWEKATRTDAAFDYVQKYGTAKLLDEWGSSKLFASEHCSVFSLLDRMLSEDPMKRISLSGALKHPWAKPLQHERGKGASRIA